MFYTERVDKALRFGDMLKGYLSTTPIIEEPFLKEPIKRYNIDVNLPIFSVVMDPCCQIGNKTISLTPLIGVYGTFFDNPYLAEDLTRINREMEPQQAVPPHVWNKLSPEEKLRRLEVGRTYAFLNLFVYEKHELVPTYTIHRKKGANIETNHYMIDFRNIFKIRCDKIISPTNAPLESKILQLSTKTRSELRSKVSFYYGSPPKEDIVLED